MMTQGQATLLQSNVRSFLGLALVGSVALMFGLMIWQTAFGENPVANAMAKTIYGQQELAQQL
jgi:hypothetical protein